MYTTYSRGFGAGYDHHYHRLANAYSCGSHYNSLAEARALESEFRAQQAARREEEAIERRLQQLRLSQHASHSRRHSFRSYHPASDDDWNSHPTLNDHRLESLRLQLAEEEQLAELEALRERRRQLEKQEKLNAVAELRRRKLEEEGLAQREKARRLRELVIIEEEEKLRRLTQKIKAQRVLPNSQQPAKKPAFPYAQRTSRPTSQDPISHLLNLALGEPVSAEDSILKPEARPKKASLPREEQTIPEAFDLGNFLQQLGLLPSPTGSRQTEKSDERRPSEQPKTAASLQQPAIPQSEASSVPVLQKEKVKPSPSPKASAALSPETTLKEQLERRLEGEYANEVRDTIIALLNSLNNIGSTHTTATPPSTSPLTPNKGKEKASSRSTTDNKTSSTNDVEDAINRVHAIESRFHALENGFEFPQQLDFSNPSSPMTPTFRRSSPSTISSQLTFTATNHPVRYYEQSLSALLSQLDAIESYGSEALRNRRKEVVRKVESALEELEQRVEARWRKESKRRSVTIEDVTTPDEYLMLPENSVPEETREVQPTEAVPTSTVPQVSEALASKVADEKPAVAKEIVQSVEESVVATRITAENAQPVPEVLVESAQDVASEKSPTLTPTDEDQSSESLELIDISMPEPTAPIVEDDTTTEQPLFTSLETLEAEVSTDVEHSVPVAESSGTDEALSEDPSTIASNPEGAELVPTPTTELTDDFCESQLDWATTIRPSTHVPLDQESATSEAEVESNLSDSEAEDEGRLLENGVVEVEHDVSDVESATSDWSEVGVDITH